jgi:hypothetical protein
MPARRAWRCFVELIASIFAVKLGRWNREKDVMFSKYIASLEGS